MAKVTKIDYDRTRAFWEVRAKSCKDGDIESITLLEQMPELAAYKDQAEKRQLLKLMDLKPHMSALDLGCGAGRWSFELAKTCSKVVAVDYSTELLKIAESEAKRRKATNIQFHRASVIEFSTPDKFDLILISGLLIYISDDDIQNLIKEVKAMLKPDGILMLREPTGVKGRVERLNRHEPSLDATYSAIYRSFHEHVKLFTEVGNLRLAYTNFAYPPFLIPLFIHNHLVPKRLRCGKPIRSFLKIAFRLNLILDPLLLQLKPVYEALIRIRSIEIAQRVYVYKSPTA